MNHSITYLFCLLFLSCTTSKINVVTALPKKLKEISAIETTNTSTILWTIEDSGNKNILYGLNTKGEIVKNITLTGVKNTDWEDLTSDDQGNIYIGDFGNNNGKRKLLHIYKILNPDNTSSKTTPFTISFRLPKKYRTKDFEAFFLWNNNFYLFSKEDNTTNIFKIPNQLGEQKAMFIGNLNLEGKKTPVTSADISNHKKTILLLNHDKFWSLTNFNEGDFSNSFIKKFNLEHTSQKEGICFKTNNAVYITDEKTNKKTGNIYEFNGL
ncbi:SdiA-regulated domain-containing protein [Aquimarina agarilytica]|uniref:SdiA-regulated domain-containing protein n=1 Tax=Aquimarina agarilytica TaxID=1087449 RepID=UPI0002899BC7|nr:SdiA-regulated domain-containing protein [Aquimarina agarilytica]